MRGSSPAMSDAMRDLLPDLLDGANHGNLVRFARVDRAWHNIATARIKLNFTTLKRMVDRLNQAYVAFTERYPAQVALPNELTDTIWMELEELCSLTGQRGFRDRHGLFGLLIDYNTVPELVQIAMHQLLLQGSQRRAEMQRMLRAVLKAPDALLEYLHGEGNVDLRLHETWPAIRAVLTAAVERRGALAGFEAVLAAYKQQAGDGAVLLPTLKQAAEEALGQLLSRPLRKLLLPSDTALRVLRYDDDRLDDAFWSPVKDLPAAWLLEVALEVQRQPLDLAAIDMLVAHIDPLLPHILVFPQLATCSDLAEWLDRPEQQDLRGRWGAWLRSCEHHRVALRRHARRVHRLAFISFRALLTEALEFAERMYGRPSPQATWIQDNYLLLLGSRRADATIAAQNWTGELPNRASMPVPTSP